MGYSGEYRAGRIVTSEGRITTQVNNAPDTPSPKRVELDALTTTVVGRTLMVGKDVKVTSVTHVDATMDEYHPMVVPALKVTPVTSMSLSREFQVKGKRFGGGFSRRSEREAKKRAKAKKAA